MTDNMQESAVASSNFKNQKSNIWDQKAKNVELQQGIELIMLTMFCVSERKLKWNKKYTKQRTMCKDISFTIAAADLIDCTDGYSK